MHRRFMLNKIWITTPQNHIVLWEKGLDLIWHVHYWKFQQSNSYRHTLTTMEWHGLEKKKRYFVNIPIYLYESLKSVGHIMVDKSRQSSTDNTTIEFTIDEPLWSTLYEKSTTRKCLFARLRRSRKMSNIVAKGY